MSNAVFREAEISDAKDIHSLVQHTIRTIYPRYYPLGVVNYFSELHSQENIFRDIDDEHMHTFVLERNGQLIGTGSCTENHITRVFVDPLFQRCGYGSIIMQNLERMIAKEYADAVLDSSLSACVMYEKRGYITEKHEVIEVGEDEYLVYEIMRKRL